MKRYTVHPTKTVDEEIIPLFETLLAEAKTDIGAQVAVENLTPRLGGLLVVWDHQTDFVHIDGSGSWSFPRTMWTS